MGDIVIGAGMAIVGIVFVLFFNSISVNLISQLMFALIFVGIALVTISFIVVEKFYEIKAAGLSTSEQAVWRTADAGKDAKCFVKYIHEIANNHVDENNQSAPKEQPIPAKA